MDNPIEFRIDELIEPVHKQINSLSASINQPDKFAQIFCDAAKSQKSIDETMKHIIKEVVSKDHEMNIFLENKIIEMYKNDWRNFMRKFGSATLVIISAIFGAAITIISRIISNKLGA